MPADLPFDEDLARRLPLPLAQLYRRAHNAKSPQERHHASYYLWEAALKLFSSVAVVSFLHSGRPPADALAALLQNLARPAVGHWWGLARALSEELAGDPGFDAVRGLLQQVRHDLPRLAGLDATLARLLEGRPGSRSTVRLAELFDRLVRYRNQEIGHGAVGQRSASHYEEVGGSLLAGLAQLLGRLDVLAGRRLLHLGEVRRLPSGLWLAERYELSGEAPRRLEPLKVTHEEAARLLPQQLYVEARPALMSLHPLVCYEFEANEALFLNARRGKRRVEYLNYTSGRVVDRVESGGQHAFLAQVLGVPVDEAQLQAWQARSQAEDGPAEEAEEPGRRLGEFELLGELGRGGMGVVYRAWQPSLGRQVALKVMFNVGDARAEARFAREIRALGRVEHPNLVKVFTSGSEGDRWFYAMELVKGATLSAVCTELQRRTADPSTIDQRLWQDALSTTCEATGASGQPEVLARPLAPAPAPAACATRARDHVQQVVELGRQVALAAQALHEAGVIHRDIKPGNVMVSPDGSTATLMDLGLAQLADEADAKLTRTRLFVGTLRYASPEQVLSVDRLDQRSDVYTLGATLWELLTLRSLYGADDNTPTAELMKRIAVEELEPIRKHNVAVPRDLEAVVLKCLEKDPKRRYGSAQELADELGRWQRGEPVRAHSRGWTYRLGKFVRRNRSWIAGAVAVLLLQAVVGFAFFLYFSRITHDRPTTHDRPNFDVKVDDRPAPVFLEALGGRRWRIEFDRTTGEAGLSVPAGKARSVLIEVPEWARGAKGRVRLLLRRWPAPVPPGVVMRFNQGPEEKVEPLGRPSPTEGILFLSPQWEFAKEEDSSVLIKIHNPTANDWSLDYEAELLPQTLYVLAVGASQTQQPLPALESARKDAEELGQVVKRQEGGLFADVKVQVLTGASCNRDAIYDGLAELKKASPSDMAVVLLSGHGDRDSNGFYLFAPNDYDPANKGRRGISGHELVLKLCEVPCPVLVFIDTAHSGAVINGVVLPREHPGLRIFASALRNQLDHARSEWQGHGPLTLALLEVLENRYRVDPHQGQDIDWPGQLRSGLVSWEDLYLHLRKRVPELSGWIDHRYRQTIQEQSSPGKDYGLYPIAAVVYPLSR